MKVSDLGYRKRWIKGEAAREAQIWVDALVAGLERERQKHLVQESKYIKFLLRKGTRVRIIDKDGRMHTGLVVKHGK